MARIRFEEAPSGSDFSASPLVGLRQGFYVDRFTGALIDPSPTNADRIADFNAVFGTAVTRVPDFVEVSTNIVVAPLTGRTRAICNVNIIFTGDSSLRPQADGAHLSCYNCKISMASKTNIGENSVIGTHAEAITTNSGLREDPTYAPEDGGVITGSSSWNAYGCDVQAIVLTFGSGSFTGGANSLQIGGDVIGSEIYFGGDRNTAGNTTFWGIAAKEGGRWIDSEMAMSPGPVATSTGVIIQYGAPTVVDQMTFRRFGFTIGQGGANAGPKLQVNPAVSDYTSLFTIQGDGRAGVGTQGNIFQVIGYTTPNAVSGAASQVISNANTFVTTSNGQGGTILYQGYEPEYYSDIALTNPIQNVNARLYSTFAATATSSTASNFGSRPDVSVADRSGLALNFAQQAVSDANGRLTSHSYSFDGSTFNDGYYDFLKFTPVATQGSETFGSTYGLEQTAPAGVIFAPMFDIRGVAGAGAKNFIQNSSRFEQRSYRYDIDISETVDGTELEVDTEYPIVQSTIVPQDLVGLRIKTTNVNDTTNVPDFSFNGSETVSPNDLTNLARAAWASFNFNPIFDGDDMRPVSGSTWDEREYPIRFVVQTSAPSSGGIISGTGYIVDENNGQLRMRIHCNGLAVSDDDVDNTINSTVYNGNNTPLDLGGTTYTASGGFTRLLEVTNGTLINNDSGAMSMTEVSSGLVTATDETRVTGTVVFTQFGAGGLENFPPILGRADGSDNITFTRADFESTGSSGIYTAAPSGAGLYNNSIWTGVTTESPVDWNMLRTITFNEGCNLEGTVSIAANVDSTWTFNALPETLDLTIPNQTSLITINTGNQAANADLTIHAGVKAWLDAQVTAGNISGYSEARTDQTAPTSGYWLVGTPESVFTATFTHQPSDDGGNFALFQRDSSTADWVQVGATLTTADDTELSIPVTNPDKQYVTLWKPKNNNTYTAVSFYDRLTGINKDEQNIASTLSIVTEVLSPDDLPAKTTATPPGDFILEWRAGTSAEELEGQLVGVIGGTNTTDQRLSNAESQAAMRQALITDAYFNIIVDNINTDGFLPDSLTGTGIRADYIVITSNTSTEADGRFIELVSQDGSQQGMTAVNAAGLTPITGPLAAILHGRDYATGEDGGATATGAEIEFSSIDIAANPAGVSGAEIRAEVVKTLVGIKGKLNNIDNNAAIADIPGIALPDIT